MFFFFLCPAGSLARVYQPARQPWRLCWGPSYQPWWPLFAAEQHQLWPLLPNLLDCQQWPRAGRRGGRSWGSSPWQWIWSLAVLRAVDKRQVMVLELETGWLMWGGCPSRWGLIGWPVCGNRLGGGIPVVDDSSSYEDLLESVFPVDDLAVDKLTD